MSRTVRLHRLGPTLVLTSVVALCVSGCAVATPAYVGPAAVVVAPRPVVVAPAPPVVFVPAPTVWGVIRVR